MWGRRKSDRAFEQQAREAFQAARGRGAIVLTVPKAEDMTAKVQAASATLARLRALIADVVAAGYHQQPPRWLPDDLWDRLTAETPGVPTVHTEPDEGLFE